MGICECCPLFQCRGWGKSSDGIAPDRENAMRQCDVTLSFVCCRPAGLQSTNMLYVNNTYSVWGLCVTGRVTGYGQFIMTEKLNDLKED